jgi:hypothetical protein
MTLPRCDVHDLDQEKTSGLGDKESGDKPRLLRPVFDPQVWDAREVALIICHQRRLLYQRMCGNPEIMIRDHFTAPCEIGFDSTESLGNRRSEGQEFHSCKESPVSAQILLYLRRAENPEVKLAERDQRNITA